MEVGGRAWGRIITQTRDKRVEDSSCLGADKQCGQAARRPGCFCQWLRHLGSLFARVVPGAVCRCLGARCGSP